MADIILITVASILTFVACCQVFFATNSYACSLELKMQNIWLQRICRIGIVLCPILLLIAVITSPAETFGGNVVLFLGCLSICVFWMFTVQLVLLCLDFLVRRISKIRTTKIQNPFRKIPTLFKRIISWLWYE